MFVEAYVTTVGVARRDLPKLLTGVGGSSSASATSATDSQSSATLGTTTGTNLKALPQMSTTTSAGLPGLTTLTPTTASFTTPAIEVPSSKGNPFITSTTKPSGTVFIGVGSAVAFILVVFALYHLIKSLMARSLAKRTVNNEKRTYQRFSDNAFYGNNTNRSSTIFENLAGPKVPPKGGSYTASQYDANNSFYDLMPPTTHQDLTNMFISPTKDVMAGKSRSLADSQVNVSTLGLGKPGLNTVGNRSSQHMPSMYFHETPSNSTLGVPTRTPDRPKRRTVPSMYLEDLLDDSPSAELNHTQERTQGSP